LAESRRDSGSGAYPHYLATSQAIEIVLAASLALAVECCALLALDAIQLLLLLSLAALLF
jgi:hypothetical protein